MTLCVHLDIKENISVCICILLTVKIHSGDNTLESCKCFWCVMYTYKFDFCNP